MAEISFSAEQFSGISRLFPIPGLVMFPHVIQPLHVFERRYQDLLAEAMSDDRLITLPVLTSGYETNDEYRPALEPTACLGKIVLHQPLKEGRANVLLLGIQRVRLLAELPQSKAFREAKVELLEDVYSPEAAASPNHLHACLFEAFKARLSRQLENSECLDALLRDETSLAVLTDIVAHTIDLSMACKVRLLSEINVERRAELLLEALAQVNPMEMSVAEQSRGFPPDFSLN